MVELIPEVNSADALVDIYAYAEQELPSYMRTRSVDVTEAMPRNSNGKLGLFVRTVFQDVSSEPK